MEREFGSGKIRLVQGDITKESTDAIVNAANPTLLGGAGLVRFVLFDAESFRTYREALGSL